MTAQVRMDETVCGALCQHPACWQSQIRQDKGFPRTFRTRPSSPDIELDLPTVKVCNMLEDYGEDTRDLYPAKHGGRPHHARQMGIPEFQKPRTQSVKMTRPPPTSPKSSAQAATLSDRKSGKSFKVVEVQEVFDPEDLQGTWDDTFISKSYYVWVPNKKKKKRRRKGKISFMDGDAETMNKKSAHSVTFKDMTETMVPKEIEESRLTSRKKHSSARSPSGRPYTLTPRGTRQEIDMEGPTRLLSVPIPSRMSGWRTDTPRQQTVFLRLSISELLDLPRDILVQVLENSRQSDLMSQERIREIIRRFVPQPLERGNTNLSLASNELLQQRKLNLHEGNKNVRTPHLMETKPVYYIDNDGVDEEEEEEVDEDMQSHYGSLKEMYFGTGGSPRDLDRFFKKPLPAIGGGGRSVSAGPGAQTKIPSISLGLPELPSGVKHTRAFTYKKGPSFDFTLAPVPTPPTSFRSSGTPASDNGTTIRVNVPSEASVRSERGSEIKDSPRVSKPVRSGDVPLHAVSPTLSTRVPNAPATTPATVNQQQSPTKSSQYIRDMTLSSAPAGTSDWPPRDRDGSPAQLLRAPVNTPGSVMQEQADTDYDREETWPPKIAGLGTIQENAVATEEYQNQPVPVSRGRSVRFEIPEVPPPPSSPELLDRHSPEGQQEPAKEGKDEPKSSDATVTITTTLPKDTLSTSSNNRQTSGYTMRTDQTTVNTSLHADNSFLKTGAEGAGPNRELSMVSSPEPWPQVNEADYDVAPLPSQANTLHNSQKRGTGKDKHERGENVLKNTPTGQLTDKTKNIKEKETVSVVLPEAKVAKKLLEDPRKVESPAPPPPSPEGKEDEQKAALSKPNSAVMTPLMEESENTGLEENEGSITVLQVAPKVPPFMSRQKSNEKQIDTFVNIDIPATVAESQSDLSVTERQPEDQHEVSDKTIPEEPEEAESVTPSEAEARNRMNATSEQSTLAARTISDRAMSEVSSSMVGPAMSQASQGPALSEDFAEVNDRPDITNDLSGIVLGSTGPATEAMLSSSNPDMTEDGGDHEGFKEDLRQEYERMKSETEGDSTTT